MPSNPQEKLQTSGMPYFILEFATKKRHIGSCVCASNVDDWFKQLLKVLHWELETFGHAALLWWNNGIACKRKKLLGSEKAGEGNPNPNQKMTANTNKQKLRSQYGEPKIHTFENVPDVNIWFWLSKYSSEVLIVPTDHFTFSQTKTAVWHINIWPSVCAPGPPLGACSRAPFLPHYSQPGRSVEGGVSKIPCRAYVCERINNNWSHFHPFC